jgi:hypothetical protein
MAAVVRLAGMLALVLSWSCTYIAPPIRLQGSPRDLERLAGEWSGDYTGNHDHRRYGSITFKLVAGESQAHGDVLMIPEGLNRPYEPYDAGESQTQSHVASRSPTALSIRFVNVSDGSVTGVLDPYWDPDRMTVATSTFRGQLTDNVIAGTFTTKYANGSAETGGQWKVTRKR